MKKRIIALVLSLAVMLGMTVISHGASATDNGIIREYEVLKAVGIANFDETVFSTEEGITVGDFLVLITNVMGNSYAAYSEEVLSGLKQQKILDEAMQADRFMEYADALKIAERTLSVGNEFGGALTLLKQSDLTRGISNTKSKFITCENALRLVYNLATTGGIYEIKSINSNGDKTLKYDKDGSLLAKFRDIYEVRGVVTENKYTSMYAEGTLADNDLKIEGELFRSESDYSDFLGMSVSAFVHKGIRDDEGTVVYMEECRGKNDIVTVEADDLIEWDKTGTRMSYYENDKKKNATVSKSAAYLYNGVVCSDFSDKMLTPQDGRIELIDNNGDSKYEVVKITAYEYVLTEYASAYSGAVGSKYSYDGCLKNFTVDQDDPKTYVEITKNGQPIQLKEIKEWDVLTVTRSLGEKPKLTRIEVCDNQLTAIADTVKLADNEVKIDGKTYTFTNAMARAIECKEPKAKVPSPSEEYTYYFASDGRIAGVYGDINASAHMGYLIKVGKKEQAFEDLIQMRLLENDGNLRTYQLADKLTFNDRKVKAEEAYTYLHPGALVDRQVISFKTNAKAEVTKITTAVQTTEKGYDGFSRTGKMTYKWRINGACFDSQVFCGKTPTIYVIPEDEENADESEYRLGSTSDFATDAEYTFEAYNLDEYAMTNILVLSMELKMNTFALVESVSTGLDSDGFPQRKINGKIGTYDNFSIPVSDSVTAFKDYYNTKTEHSIDALEAGDLLLLAINNNGEVEQLQRLYTLADGKRPRLTLENLVQINDFSNFTTYNTFDVVDRYTAATVKKTSAANSLILMDYVYDFGSRTQAVKVRENTQYTVVDGKRGKILPGRFSSIEPGDYIFMEIYASYARNVIVIKNI